MATFDGENLVITLDATGGTGTVDVLEDLYEQWKAWQLASGPGGSSNRRYPQAFSPDGGNDLTPGIKQGQYTFLRNDLGWRIRPAEEDATILFVGNLVPSDSTLPILVPTVGAYTVGVFGLQPITQGVGELIELQQSAPADTAAAVWNESLSAYGSGTAGRAVILSAYEAAIWIDTKNGVAGSVLGVNGLPGNPVSNLADAITLATALGVRKYKIIGTLTLGSSHSDWEFFGIGTESVVALNGQDVQDSYFENLGLSGDCAGYRIRAHDCELDGVTNMIVRGERCRLINGNSLAAGDHILADCRSFVAGAGTPTLDMQGAGRTLSMRAYSGGIEIQNMTDPGNLITIELVAGQIVLAASCTDGSAELRGVGRLTDLSSLSNVNADALLSRSEISEAVHSRDRYTRRDQMVYDATTGILLSARERWFATRADAIAGTNPTDVFTVTVTADLVEVRKPATFDKIRDV